VKERLPLLVGLTFVAVALGLGAFAIGDGIRDRNKNDVITVTGSAKKRIVSDYIVWDVSVTSQQATPQGASGELAGWTKQIRGFLVGSGAQPQEVTLQPISTETVTANGGSGRVIGYRLTRSFRVRSSRVEAIASVVEKSAALLAQGIPLAAQPPQYIYTKLASLRPGLLADATKDALNRARVLVGSTGGRLGHLRNVNVGVFQVTSPNSTDVSDYGVYDTSTLEKDVTAVVNVTFALR
jgi:hypothetical protein